MRAMTKEQRVASRLVGYGLPADAVKDFRSSELAEVWTYQQAGALYAIGFWGSSAKASFYNRFRNEGQRDEKIDQFFKSADGWDVRKAAAKAERQAAPRGMDVGDVLRSSWGYDQTNIDYYQVTKLIGKSKVEIRAIAQEREATQWLAGKCVPVVDKFIGEPMVKVAKNGGVRIASYAGAYKMEGKDLGGGKKVYSSSFYSEYA